MTFKPMLAGKYDATDYQNPLRFPVMASVKLDGVRALVIGGRVMSRSLKPIPNAWVQKQFGGLPEGTDGELIYGDPTHPDAYRNTVSAVMSEDGTPTQVRFLVFDNFTYSGGFQNRFGNLRLHFEHHPNSHVQVVPHSIVTSIQQLEQIEQIAVEAGHEGIMVRSHDGPYKQGRSTAKEGFLLKVKRFEDAEAVVLGTYEWQANNNAAVKNALGHTERSSHKENLVGRNVLGGIDVRGLSGKYEGVEFSIGTGFSGADLEWVLDQDGNPTDVHAERWLLWHNRASLIGKVAKFKYFPTGSKDKPRFPVFLGWRDKLDISE